MTLKIHRLTGADLGLLRQLNAVFAEAFDDAETYGGAPPGEVYWQEVLGKDHVIVLGALKEGAVVGGLVAYELHKLERARSEIYIYDLAVGASHRRQGIATRLIEHVRLIARERGAWVVFVQADHGDDPAISLYGKLGTREEVLHFDLPVQSMGRSP
jgi:aminoglycoside 3-N-acetyltransferase I